MNGFLIIFFYGLSIFVELIKTDQGELKETCSRTPVCVYVARHSQVSRVDMKKITTTKNREE